MSKVYVIGLQTDKSEEAHKELRSPFGASRLYKPLILSLLELLPSVAFFLRLTTETDRFLFP